MAFGDNGNRKPTAFEHLVKFVVILMLVLTVGTIVFSALNMLM